MSDEQVTFQDVIPQKVYVTRCEDCKNFKPETEYPGYDGTCWMWAYQLTKKDWYCSRAERRKT